MSLVRGRIAPSKPPFRKEVALSTPNRESKQAQTSDAPTVTQGGAMPGASESSNDENAYPRPDATQPGTMPQAVADSIGDPTGSQNREQLSALAEKQGIDGYATLSRAELAEVLTATMSREDLIKALVPGAAR